MNVSEKKEKKKDEAKQEPGKIWQSLSRTSRLLIYFSVGFPHVY